MHRLALSLPLALLLAAPAAADEPPSLDLALSRLRACAISGAAGAPRESLEAALVAVRSLCLAQIRTAHRASDAVVDADNVGLNPDDLDQRRAKARRKIDFDLARLVATLTGVQP